MSKKIMGMIVVAVIVIAVGGGFLLIKNIGDKALNPEGEYESLECHTVYCRDGAIEWDGNIESDAPKTLVIESVEGGILEGTWCGDFIRGTYQDGFLRFQCTYTENGVMAIDTVSGFSFLGIMVVSGVTETMGGEDIGAFNQALVKWGVEDAEMTIEEIGFGYLEPGDVLDMYGGIVFDGDVSDIEGDSTLTFLETRNNLGLFRIDGSYGMTILANAGEFGLATAIGITDGGDIRHLDMEFRDDQVIINDARGTGERSMLMFTAYGEGPVYHMPFEYGERFGNETQTYRFGNHAGNLIEVIDGFGGKYVASTYKVLGGDALRFIMDFDVGSSVFTGICEGFVQEDGKATFTFVGIDDAGTILALVTEMDRIMDGSAS